MAFRFPLETLLRFRCSVERQKELKLLHAAQQVAITQKEIQIVDQSLCAIEESEQQNLETAVRAAQLHFNALFRSVLGQRRFELVNILTQQRNLCAQCQEEFQLAHRGREAVEVLREEQLERYQREETRREQRRIDDLFLLRREYLLRR